MIGWSGTEILKLSANHKQLIARYRVYLRVPYDNQTGIGMDMATDTLNVRSIPYLRDRDSFGM